jgi:hypothetical protein
VGSGSRMRGAAPTCVIDGTVSENAAVSGAATEWTGERTPAVTEQQSAAGAARRGPAGTVGAWQPEWPRMPAFAPKHWAKQGPNRPMM